MNIKYFADFYNQFIIFYNIFLHHYRHQRNKETEFEAIHFGYSIQKFNMKEKMGKIREVLKMYKRELGLAKEDYSKIKKWTYKKDTSGTIKETPRISRKAPKSIKKNKITKQFFCH